MIGDIVLMQSRTDQDNVHTGIYTGHEGGLLHADGLYEQCVVENNVRIPYSARILNTRTIVRLIK